MVRRSWTRGQVESEKWLAVLISNSIPHIVLRNESHELFCKPTIRFYKIAPWLTNALTPHDASDRESRKDICPYFLRYTYFLHPVEGCLSILLLTCSKGGCIWEGIILFSILKRYLYIAINGEVKFYNYHICLLFFMKNTFPKAKVFENVLLYFMFCLCIFYYYLFFKKIRYLSIHFYLWNMLVLFRMFISLFIK